MLLEEYPFDSGYSHITSILPRANIYITTPSLAVERGHIHYYARGREAGRSIVHLVVLARRRRFGAPYSRTAATPTTGVNSASTS